MSGKTSTCAREIHYTVSTVASIPYSYKCLVGIAHWISHTIFRLFDTDRRSRVAMRYEWHVSAKMSGQGHCHCYNRSSRVPTLTVAEGPQKQDTVTNVRKRSRAGSPVLMQRILHAEDIARGHDLPQVPVFLCRWPHVPALSSRRKTTAEEQDRAEHCSANLSFSVRRSPLLLLALWCTAITIELRQEGAGDREILQYVRMSLPYGFVLDPVVASKSISTNTGKQSGSDTDSG